MRGRARQLRALLLEWLLLARLERRDGAAEKVERLFPGIGEDECEQILVRWVAWAVIWVFLLGLKLVTDALVIVFVVQLALNTAHTLHARLWPQSTVFRRKAGVVVDQYPGLALAALTSPVTAPLYFIYATVSVGYGLRFGPSYGVMSALVCGSGLAAITAIVPEYRAEWLWMLSTIGLVTLVPIYSAYLSARIGRRQERMKAEGVFGH